MTLDGVSILLDGLSGRVEQYLPTPPEIVREIFENPPDLLAFTHAHKDHYDENLVSQYKSYSSGPILGPENLPLGNVSGPVTIRGVRITPIPSRHLGKADPGLRHVSFLIEGSQKIFFAGDAAPSQWKNRLDLPRPDVLIGPYAYALTDSAWRQTCGTVKHFVLVHLPEENQDPYGLWPAVRQVIGPDPGIDLQIPQVGQRIFI